MILHGIEPTAEYRPNRHGGVALVLIWRAEGIDLLARLQPDGSGRVHEISPGYDPAVGRAVPIERPLLYFSHALADRMREGAAASDLSDEASRIVTHLLSHPNPETDRPSAVAALRALTSHFADLSSAHVLPCTTPKRDDEDEDEDFGGLFPWHLSEFTEDFLRAMRKDGDLDGWTLRRPVYPESGFLEYSSRKLLWEGGGGWSAHERLEAMLSIEAWCRSSPSWKAYGGLGERRLRVLREAFEEAAAGK